MGGRYTWESARFHSYLRRIPLVLSARWSLPVPPAITLAGCVRDEAAAAVAIVVVGVGSVCHNEECVRLGVSSAVTGGAGAPGVTLGPMHRREVTG